MDADYVKGFVERDWTLLNRLEHEAWLDDFRGTTPEQRLRVCARAGELARAMSPGWPSDSDRDADLAHHRSMIAGFRRVEP
ncbi:MAG TPA: hypothetical protein QGF58_21750 [Myxococcota bacterium]|nr:hypothetical protein [Myxococcota bacterium]